MAPKFGTSGLRGLVTDLTKECVQGYVAAFAKACPIGTGLYVGHDLRASSPTLAGYIADAGSKAGLAVTFCGPVPTPALALAAMQANAAAIMVTGSHIPADRNGLKFYTSSGEITKVDEQAILGAVGTVLPDALGPTPVARTDVAAQYSARYQLAFGETLQGKKIGVYAHSAVGRDSLQALLRDLGAIVIALGRSDVFVPVDTEAVGQDLRAQLRKWAQEHRLDAIISTDADGDRPLLADEAGEIVVGDVMGQITARGLGADHVVTPVSSNSGVLLGGHFQSVSQTKIGSPFVIAGMQAQSGKTVGYEANGGFLLGFDAQGPTGPLPALMTRDALLPILMVLSMSCDSSVADLVAQEPACFTASDRLQEIDTTRAKMVISDLSTSAESRDNFLSVFKAKGAKIDATDGLRFSLHDGCVVHLRLSGNAPELRVYAEAKTVSKAQEILQRGLLETERLLNL